MLLDASGLLAALVSDEQYHETTARALDQADPPLVLSPFVAAELDYLLLTRVGARAELTFLDDVAQGAYMLAPFSPDDIGLALEVLRRYSDLNIGLADASLVVLAQRHGTLDVLTLDERHFRALRGPGERPFRLLPMDDLE
jgi:uncharacterized protein